MNTQRGNGCVEGLDGAEEASNPPAAETEFPPAKAKRSKYYSEKATEYALTQSTCPHCGVTGRGPVMHRHHHDRCKRRPQPMTSGKALVADYSWLIDALKEHCDDVHVELLDYDTSLMVAALWNVPGRKVPHGHAIRCQFVYNEGGAWTEGDLDDGGHWEGGEWKVFSLNELMVEKGWTREHVIATVVEKRPKAAA